MTTERPDGPQNQAVTQLTFMDESVLTVWWDGKHEVSGLYGTGATVMIYSPECRTEIPWHRIAMVKHWDKPESDE